MKLSIITINYNKAETCAKRWLLLPCKPIETSKRYHEVASKELKNVNWSKQPHRAKAQYEKY